MNKQIAIIGVVLTTILIILEQVLQLDSFIKQAYKLLFLVVFPLLIIYFYKKSTFQKEYNLKQVSKADIKIPLLAGITIYILTIIGYFIFQGIIDTDTLITGLTDRGITPSNIILASIYLSFVNSFIEEFFFRGFIYQHVAALSEKAGYIVSGALFSIYHVLVMFAIFNWIMGVLAMIGLMIVGMILVYINRPNKSIINSWIMHIFADLGVVTIGLFLFFT